MGVNEVAHALTSSQLKKNRSGNKTKTTIFILTVRSRKFSAQTANTAVFFILLVCAVVSFFVCLGRFAIHHPCWLDRRKVISVDRIRLFIFVIRIRKFYCQRDFRQILQDIGNEMATFFESCVVGAGVRGWI